MDQKIYYVVSIGSCSCVFDNIKDASYFMKEAAEHIKATRYQSERPGIEMVALTETGIRKLCPREYDTDIQDGAESEV